MVAGLLERIDRNTQLAGHNRLALLLFRLNSGRIFGINVFKVQEVIPSPPLVTTPSAHPLVRGVADLRGSIVPVIDLAAALGEPSEGPATRVIITEYNRRVQGFLVHGVDRILHVDVAAVESPPGNASNSYLTAITRHGDELIEIVDVEKVLAEVIGDAPDLSERLVGQATRLSVGRRILVVDDSRVALNQIERTLKQIGVDCVMVNDGLEALQYLQDLAQRGPIEQELLMVISDIEMPRMDGYTLTTEIRRDVRLRGLYVLLHTSLSGVFNQAMVAKVAANRFVPKFSADELAGCVIECLQGLEQAAAAHAA